MKIKKTTIFLALITTFMLLLIACFNSPDTQEWISLNLFYGPIYSLFQNYKYPSLVAIYIQIALFILFLSSVVYASISTISDKNKTLLNRLIFVIGIFFVFFILYAISENQLSDIKFYLEGKSISETSNLDKVKRVKTRGRGGSGRSGHSYYDYRFYTNTIQEKSRRDTVYQYLRLNTYQYKELSEKLKNIDKNKYKTDSIPVVIYYLPKTRNVIQYEIIE